MTRMAVSWLEQLRTAAHSLTKSIDITSTNNNGTMLQGYE